MTIEELAKLKKGDKLNYLGQVVDYVDVLVILDGKYGGNTARLHALSLIPGPTLPPHVAEVFEWDGEPQGFKQEDGWVWHEGWKWPHHGINYTNAWRLIPKIRKESE